jgi:hypothetical protein
MTQFDFHRQISGLTVYEKWSLSIVGKGRAMAEAVSQQSFIAEDQVHSLVSPCGICGGQSGTGTVFSLSS